MAQRSLVEYFMIIDQIEMMHTNDKQSPKI